MPRKKHRIIKLLEETGESLYPSEIADRLKLNRSTIRNYVRDLSEDGDIIRLEGGRYCSKATYGVVMPLLIHNLRFRVEAPWLRDMSKIGDDDELYGGAHFWVQYGKRNGLITGGFAYDKGLDQAHILMLFGRFYELAERKTGHKLGPFVVTTEEWNRDYVGKRIDNRDGLRCFTLGEYGSYLERIYQHKDNVVRVETKVSKPMSIGELLEIQRSGSLGFARDLEIVNELREDMRNLIEVNKFFNAKMNDLGRNQATLTEAFKSQVEVFKRHSELLEKRAREDADLRKSMLELQDVMRRDIEALTKLISWKEQSEAEGLKKANSYRS